MDMKTQFLDYSGLGEAVNLIKKYIADHKEILPYASLGSFPKIGNEDCLYIDISSGLFYRWNTNGKQYILLGGKSVKEVSIESGSTNGTIKLIVDGVKTDNIEIKGLGAAAFIDNYAGSTIPGGPAINAMDIASQTPILAVGDEQNNISVKKNTNGTFMNGEINVEVNLSVNGKALNVDGKTLTVAQSNTSDKYAMRNALDFAWYKTHWQIGNVRSNAEDSIGFGFAYSNDEGEHFIPKALLSDSGQFTVDSLKANIILGDLSGNATSASKVPWSGVSGKPSSYPPSSHTHSYLPLSGGSLSGSFHSKPTASGSYNENIRIHPSPSNWTSIVMCGDDNTGDSGTSAKTWGIFTHNGVFGISKNGNGDSTLGPASLRCDTSNIWYINGNTILHSANYNSYAPTKTGGGASGTWSISVSGNAATATKLATARSITLGGLSSGSANFDGSGNITIDDWGYGVTKYINENSTSTPYTRIAYASADYSWYDGSMVFVIDSGYANGGYGIIKVCMRSNDIRTKDNSTCEVRWLVRQGFSAEQIFIKGYAPENGTQYADLYFKANGTYNAITIRVLSSGGRGNRLRTWTFDGSASRANPDIRTYSYTVTGCDSGTANYANSAGVASKLNNITADWSGQISSTSWFAAFNPSTAGELRAISIANVKSVLGISNVNNTADANKSVKYATSAGSAGSVAWGNVSGRPSSLPASDVYAWAKASTKPSYSYTEITNRPTLIKAVSKNGYWGMADHDGSDSNWIRTTTAGIIPYQSGGAGGGHCGIGTSSWYFSNAYIDTVNCVNTNASGYLQANGLINTFSEYQSQRGKRDWRFGSATGTGDQNWFGFYDYTSGYHGGIYGPDHLLRMGGEIQSTAANGFRAVQGNYGFIIRNDGANVYFMMTGNGDPWGGWNDNYTIFTPNGEWQIKKSPYDNGMSTSRGYVVVSDSNADRVYSISNNANYLKVRGGLNTYHCTYSNSDIRLKKNINNTSITNALSVINSIKVRQFDWKETNIHQSIGFVADELEKLDPNFSQGGGVTKDGGIDVKSVNSFYLQGYIVKALQELSSQVSDLKQENKRLKQKLNMCN